MSLFILRTSRKPYRIFERSLISKPREFVFMFGLVMD